MQTALWLRRFRGRPFVLAVEDEPSRVVIPILHAVATTAGASRVELLEPDGTQRRLLVPELVAGVSRTLATTAGWQVLRRRTERELGRLVEAEPLVPVWNDSRRIGYINSNLWFGLSAGGSVAHVSGVINGFVRHGYNVDLFAAGPAPLTDGRVKLHVIPPPYPLALRGEANVQRFQRSAIATVLEHASDPYAFLYQRNSIGSYAGAATSRRLRAPLVIEYNGSEVWTATRWGRGLSHEDLALAAEEASLRHAHVVVTVSDVLRDELLERGISPERIVAHPNGVDAERYSPDAMSQHERSALRRRLDIPEDAIVAGFIGTFGQWHGVDVLARAIVRLADEDPSLFVNEGLRFLVVGDGMRMSDVESTLRGTKAQTFVTLTGLVPQSSGVQYLGASDLLLSPHVANPDGSRFFGSPTKLFEYMAVGKAIVASALEQIYDVLKPGLHVSELPGGPPADDAPENALFTTPGDVDELVAAIRWLARQPEWRARLGANARARVLARYTWDHHVDSIVDRVASLSG